MPDPIPAGTDDQGNPLVSCAACSAVVPAEEAYDGLCPECRGY